MNAAGPVFDRGPEIQASHWYVKFINHTGSAPFKDFCIFPNIQDKP
jgi:hypothetical protein